LEVDSNNIFSAGHTTILKRPDGIMEVHTHEDLCYEIEHMKEINAVFEKIIPGQRVPMFFIAGRYTSVSTEAREWGGTEEATRFSIAEAYVIQSLAQKMIANFYLRFDKPAVPTRFFNSKEEAERWLKGFL